MYKRLPQTPNVVSFETWVRMPTVASGSSADVCNFGFWNTDEGSWTTGYAGISVDSQNQTYTAFVGTGTRMIDLPYAAGQWIKFKLRYDVPNRLIDVWANDVLKVQGLTGTVAAQGYRDFVLTAGWGGSIWHFDDISVWAESSTTITLTPLSQQVAFGYPPGTAPLTVTVTDQHGAPMVGVVVNLSTTFGVLSAPSVTTSALGTATFNLTSNANGNASVTASSAGVTSNIATVEFLYFPPPGS